MLKTFFKKIIGRSDKDDKPSILESFNRKSEKYLKLASEKFCNARDELITIKSKFKNLREVNYNLGMKHLEKGNLVDAIFRFQFIKKFWPDLFDAYYQLAYCFVLKNEYRKARNVLQELLVKNPDYDIKARELLERVNSALKQDMSQDGPNV